MQRDFFAFECVGQAGIAEPHLGEGGEIGGNDHIDLFGGRLEADLDVVGQQHQPPVARAVAGFGDAAEIEADDKALRRDFRWIDLPPHSPDQHSGIEIVGADQPLAPALAPHAQQFDDRPKILAGRRKPIEVTFALGFRLDVDHAGVGELLETLR